MATPWTLADDSDQARNFALSDEDSMQGLAALGSRALASGKVTLKEAQANAKKMGLKPKPGGKVGPVEGRAASQMPAGPVDNRTLTQDQQAWSPLSMMPPQGPTGPLDMSGGAARARPQPLPTAQSLYQQQVAGTPSRIGAKAEVEDTQKADSGSKTVRSSTLSKPAQQAQAEMILGMGGEPEITGYEPLVDADGTPRLSPSGRPMDDTSKPIYDLNKVKWNPGHPYQEEKRGIDQMEALNRAQAEANQGRSHLDLSPLMALADSFKDVPGVQTHLADAYKRPEDGTDKVMAYAGEAQKRRAELQKALYQNVKNLNGGSELQQLTTALALGSKVGASQNTPPPPRPVNPNAPVTNAHKWFTGMQGALKDTDKSFKGANAAYDMLKQGTSVADSNFRFALLKALEAGRITNYELQNEQGGKAFNTKLDQVINNVETGKLTDQNRGEYLQLLGGLTQESKDFRDYVTNNYRTAGTNIYRMDPNQVDTQIKAVMSSPAAKINPQAVIQHGKAVARPAPSSPAPEGMIRVREKATGKTGVVPAGKFNANRFDKVE